MADADLKKNGVISLVEHFAEALTEYGAPIYYIEDVIARIARKLYADGEYLVIFGAFFSACGKYLQQKVTLTRLPNAGFNIEKLNQTRALAENVIEGKINEQEAEAVLVSLKKQNPIYPEWVVIFSWWLASSSIAFLFGGAWKDALVAGIIGLIAAVISSIFSRSREWSKLVEVSSAFIGSFIAVGGMLLFGNYKYQMPIVLVCGLIILMPGFSFTRAMSELAKGHFVSGTARFVSAVLTLTFLCAGTYAGFAIIKVFVPVSIQSFTITPPKPLALLLICVPQAISLCLSFYVHWRYLLAVVLTDIIVVFVMIYGGMVMGGALGCGIGAFVVSIVANAYARNRNCSSVVIKLPCIMVLVPGSFGFNAMVTILANNPNAGVEAAVMMIITSISIVVGTILADSLYPSK